MNFAFNVVDALETSGAAFETSRVARIGYSNTFGNVGAPAYSETPSDHGGNLTEDPLFVDVTDADPLLWDLRLQPTSPLVDAGNSAQSDPDGTPPDIGSYGGPTVNP